MKQWSFFAVVFVVSFTAGANSCGAEKGEKRHPLEGTWRLLMWKDEMAAVYANARGTEVEQKTFSTNHTIWLVYDPLTKQVSRGAGASFQVKDDKFEEVPRYTMGPYGPTELLDKKYESTWKIKDGNLHTWTTVNRVKTKHMGTHQVASL